MTTHVHPAPSATEQSFTLNPLRWSQRTGALVTGAALAAMVFLSVFGYLIAITGLVTVGDAAKTTAAIAASPALWLAGIGAMGVVAVLDVVAAAGTYALFKPGHRALSAVAAAMRTAYAALLTVALSQLVLAFTTLDSPGAALADIETFSSIWNTALGLFGVVLLLIAYLAIRSGFIPRVFGILIGIAGVGYIADLIGLVVVPGFSPTFGLFGFVGETAMIFWLLIGGRRLPRS